MPKIKKQKFETTLSSLTLDLGSSPVETKDVLYFESIRSPITQDSEQSLFPRKTEHTSRR